MVLESTNGGMGAFMKVFLWSFQKNNSFIN